MSFFTNLRADRLVADIRSGSGPNDPVVQKAAAKLKDLGPGAIDAVLAAVPEADKNVTLVLVDVLSALVNQKAFPRLVLGLVEGSPRVIAAISWALTSSKSIPPQMLLDTLAHPGISKSAILEIVAAQKARFGVRDLLA